MLYSGENNTLPKLPYLDLAQFESKSVLEKFFILLAFVIGTIFFCFLALFSFIAFYLGFVSTLEIGAGWLNRKMVTKQEDGWLLAKERDGWLRREMGG